MALLRRPDDEGRPTGARTHRVWTDDEEAARVYRRMLRRRGDSTIVADSVRLRWLLAALDNPGSRLPTGALHSHWRTVLRDEGLLG